jgi:DNA helicase II / ATP-dependent DNA helicase PcrA
MRIVADLHVHSSFSRATSPKLRPDYLDRWARVKGVGLVGTGDCTHPGYLARLGEALEDADGGFYRLRPEARRAFDAGEALADGLPAAGGGGSGSSEARFAVTGEISTIYSDRGRTRKVHHLVVLPSLGAAAAFQSLLARVGNIASDGRPILGLSSRDLFGLLLEADERSILVPAHIWTPWFSALGSRSGYDSIDECYGDLAGKIGAIETGLSSNPPMNWAVSSLDRFAIVSNSDAHSPDKLGREATVLEMEDSYEGLRDALSGADGGRRGRVVGTVEFFPQEGKYHYDGHRACGVVLSPEESARTKGLCPSCGKPLTPGVAGRVAELADRPVDEYAPCPSGGVGGNRRPYSSLIPLAELLGELIGVGSGSKKVAASYNALIEEAGSELALLSDMDIAAIEAMRSRGVPGALLAEAVARMRAGKVHVRPGYDGEYGEIRAFAPGEELARMRQDALIDEPSDGGAAPPEGRGAPPRARAAPTEGRAAGKRAGQERPPRGAAVRIADAGEAAPALDSAQLAAVGHGAGPALVLAGPGAGKTSVIAARIARLVEEGAGTGSILALTFTNRAAGELRARIARSIGEERASRLIASTFHSFCLSILRERSADAGLPEDFKVLGEEDRAAALELAARSMSASRPRAGTLGRYVESRKRRLLLPGDEIPRLGPAAPAGLAELAAELGSSALDAGLDAGYAAYRDALRASASLDFDDLVAGTARLLSARPAALDAYRRRFRAIFVDEYQDVDFAQYALLRILAAGIGGGAGIGDAAGEEGTARRSLFVIGDPNQSIYGFRGSDPRFVGLFAEDFPGAAVYRLSRSFRCAAPIVGAAGRLVSAGLEGSGGAVALSRREYATEAAEAEGIAREIDRMIGGTRFFAMDSGVAVGEGGLRSLGECAVLLRAAVLAPAIEKALDDHAIPYSTIGEEEARARPPDGSIVSLIRPERVSIMTIHAAKGLEFDHVFVPALEEGILPFTLYDGSEEQGGPSRDERRDEERRILYVAMTRARIGLRLSWARARSFRGRPLELPPSSFLAEIGDLVPLEEERGPRRERDHQLGLF